MQCTQSRATINPKAKKSHEQHQRIFRTSRGHNPIKQDFWGKSHQKVHPKVRQHKFFWVPFLSKIFVAQVLLGTFSVPDHSSRRRSTPRNPPLTTKAPLRPTYLPSGDVPDWSLILEGVLQDFFRDKQTLDTLASSPPRGGRFCQLHIAFLFSYSIPTPATNQ